MGDFDRNSGASGEKPSETKKMVIVLALGVLLIGLVAMQMMKKGDGPQQAAGAPVGNGVTLPAPVMADEISPSALAVMKADLQNDPTKPLLVADLRSDTSFYDVPRNPFAMSRLLLDGVTVVGPGPVLPPTPVATRTADPVATAPVAQPLAPRAEEYKLSSIVNQNNVLSAIINGKIVKVGDVVDKARVVDIRESAVILQRADAPGGPTIELSTQRKWN